jgi:hypothetical protein
MVYYYNYSILLVIVNLMCLVNKLYHRYVSIEKNIACIYTYIYKHIYIYLWLRPIYDLLRHHWEDLRIIPHG